MEPSADVNRCAEHPDRPATEGLCLRCGSFMCAECRSPARSVPRCRRCLALVVSRGRARHLPSLGVMMIVHGCLLVLMGIFHVLSMAMVALVMQNADVSNRDELLASGVLGMTAGWMLLVAALHAVPGVLQVVAGVKVRRQRGRVVAFIALGSAMTSVLGCYCAPTSIALLIWGLVVLMSEGVPEVFEAADVGSATSQ